MKFKKAYLFIFTFFTYRSFLDLEADKFIEKNPEVAVYITERKGRSPRLIANYCEFGYYITRKDVEMGLEPSSSIVFEILVLAKICACKNRFT